MWKITFTAVTALCAVTATPATAREHIGEQNVTKKVVLDLPIRGVKVSGPPFLVNIFGGIGKPPIPHCKAGQEVQYEIQSEYRTENVRQRGGRSSGGNFASIDRRVTCVKMKDRSSGAD